MTVKDVYNVIDNYAPFKLQDDFDNSGLLVGNMSDEVTKICVCLDITNDIVEEAHQKGANVIVSHHPVIFDPLKYVKKNSPVFLLAKYGINAICAHTNVDMTISGLSDEMLELLQLQGDEILKPISSQPGIGYGRIASLPREVTAEILAKLCKATFGCHTVRYCDSGKLLKRVAFAGGACGSELDTAIEKSCDAFVTGDVKWSAFVQAKNEGITLIDIGHFDSENIIVPHFIQILQRNRECTGIEVFAAETNGNVLSYV